MFRISISFRKMVAQLTIVTLILLGHLAFIFSQSEHKGVSTKIYPTGRDEVGDLTEVSLKDVNLVARCESPINPTEWVFDFDDTNITSPKFPCGHSEWNYRWHAFEGHLNKSLILFRCDNFDSESEFTMACRSVTNHSDNVLVKFEANKTLGQIYITKQRGGWVEYSKPQNNNPDTCVRFTLAQTRTEKYWKCEGSDGKPGQINIRYCDEAQTCANMQRKLKLVPVCVDTLANPRHLQPSSDQGWLRMDADKADKFPAGTIRCETKGGEHRGAALEYFFAGKDRSTFHFSVSEVSMNELIWYDPKPASTTFYTQDKFEAECKVSEYGFGWDPRLVVKLNGSLLYSETERFNRLANVYVWTKKVAISFDDEGFGPGNYEVECSAPVWNTSEWASQTLKLEVHELVPPYFDVDQEHVMAKEGDANVRLQCDALGDPAPNVTWSHGIVPGLRVDGRVLIIPSVRAEWVNGSTVSCTAVNKFGQRATKTFQIHVTSDEDSTNSGWTIVAIVVLVIVLLAMGLGLLYLYFRFARMGKAVAQVLSDEEVKDFEQGRPGSVVGGEEDQLAIECLPYNSEFEVAKECLHVDFNNELGSGQYGVVYEGQIKQKPDTTSIPTKVAVKTVRPNVPIEYFKALLSELKILAYIGQHENIAKLVGAYSSNIRQRELFVGVEFCKTSLLNYLRKNAVHFTATATAKCVETCFSEEGGNEYGNIGQSVTTLDLIRWSGEIAAGMDYLASKRVVHGDLAARNVLLSLNLRAKICDFGLARQLVDYTYIKATKCSLPWKWMAIESLRQMHFSTMSDVWSYGVTCWEIFSLGDVPYPCMAWSWEFVDGLVAGNRLTKPKHANPEIFSMLVRCWLEKKERRPHFSELKRFFQGQERQIANSDGYADMDEFN